jgi:hypothetical protein
LISDPDLNSIRTMRDAGRRCNSISEGKARRAASDRFYLSEQRSL